MSQSLARSAPAFADSSRGFGTRWRLTALLLLLFWAAWMSDVNVRLLFSSQAWAAIGDFLRRLFPPDLSFSFVHVALRATVITAATALLSTVLASLIALPLGIVASGRLWRLSIPAGSRNNHGLSVMSVVSWITLYGMGLVRSVPDLVWALLFVAALGLGPAAGTLALTVFYTALLGRVYADIFDSADVRPLEALQAVGATRLQILLFGILPQSRALLASYTLYSFECSVRSAAVLGFVGAGGLGYEISLSMRLFEYSQVLTLLLCFVVLLFAVDFVSRLLRGRMQGSLESTRIAYPAFMRQVGGKWVAALCLLVLLLFSLAPAGMTPGDLLQNDALRNIAGFIRPLLKPEISGPFLWEAARLALQTISISILGTVSGALIGLLLAFPATRFRPAQHESLYRSWPRKLQAESTFWSTRMLLNLLRAIPELVWVLVCVIAVGFGPFAGSLALGLHTGGVLGKLFAETLEEASQHQVEALLAVGSSPLQCMLWALLPQAWPMMRRYILLRWDMNLRAATILGLVGGGGLGQALYNNVQLSDFAKVSTLIAAVIVLVVVSDWLGQPSARLEVRA